MFVVVNVLVIVQNRIKIHQQITQIPNIITIVLDVIAVALVKCVFLEYICSYNHCDMVVVLSKSGQSKRTNYSCHFHKNLFYFKCPVLNFIVNFSYATPTSTETTSAIGLYDCMSCKSFIPNEQEISHRRNILSLSSILFPVSTERQLVIIFCIVYRKDFVTHNNKMNNIAPVTDAMVKYFDNNIYNFILFIFTILYLAYYDFKLILNLIFKLYVDFIVKSIYGKLCRHLSHYFRIIYMNLIAKCWTHKMCTALKNSMIFLL